MKTAMRGLVYLWLWLLVAGCRAAPEAPIVTPAGAVPPTEAPPPTATAGPPLFSPVSDRPVFSHGGEGDWYAGAVEPGAVVRLDGGWHLFFNGFTGWPAKAGVGHAVSDNGRDWSLVSESPVLDSSAAVFDGFTFFVSSVIQLDGGEWAMYLYTLDEGRDGAPGGILMAVSETPDGAWTLQPGYILSPGEPGRWDGSRVTQPHVIRGPEGYRMYFSGYENDRLQGGRQIGVAFSADGYAWAKQVEPVFSVSDTPGAWDSYRVFQPRVLLINGGYLMAYKANVSVGRAEGWGLAFSEDGLAWERYGGNPIIEEDTYGIEWRRNGIGDLLYTDGTLYFFLEILEREGGGYHHGNAAYGSSVFLFAAAGVPVP